MSRELNEKEREYWNTNIQKPLRPSFYFAADAVCFITHKSSDKELISLEEIKSSLLGNEQKFVFKGVNTNLNAVLHKLGLKHTEVKFRAVKGMKILSKPFLKILI